MISDPVPTARAVGPEAASTRALATPDPLIQVADPSDNGTDPAKPGRFRYARWEAVLGGEREAVPVPFYFP